MVREIHSRVCDLPKSLQSVLSQVGYGRVDIALKAREATTMSSGGGDGYRAFAAIVNLATGASQIEWGSWGGPNMFSTGAVDNDTKSYPIVPGTAVVLGSKGGDRPVYASVYLHPENIAKMLPPKAELSDRDTKILAAFCGLKSFARKEALEQCGVRLEPADLARLAQAGLVKVNKAGASQITTEGRNALAGLDIWTILHG